VPGLNSNDFKPLIIIGRNSIIKIGIYLMLTLPLFTEVTEAQYATRKLSKKQQAYIDSLKQVEYNYVFPIWGQKAYQQGFDLPYPAGIMGNFIWMKQGIAIENFQLGIQNENVDLPMTPIDFIDFGSNTNTSYASNIRPDLWIFPFLNVYGLFGYGSSTTEVNLVEPVAMKSIVKQNMSTAGFGFMGAFGLGPLWMSVDANWTWTKPELLDDPVRVGVLGLRLGKTFVFKNHPDRNIAFWAGGMRARMASSTVGQIKMADAIPQETWDRVDEIVADYYTWYDSLDPVRQAIVDNSAFPDFINALDSRDGNTTVRYGMDKSPVQEWNVVIGAQFQVNKSWQIRTEGGIIGDRKSFLASVNYRFKI
jgi:hypothetical protein